MAPESTDRAHMPRPAGWLVLIVGPSGAGKDTIIEGARNRFGNKRGLIFPRRYITRPPDKAEDHIPCSEEEFQRLLASNGIVLHWQAHGLSYGVPASIVADIAAGHIVSVNVSRRTIASARAVFSRLRVVLIDAPADLRARRIADRGREGASDAAARMERASGDFDQSSADLLIVNDRSVDSAVDRICDFLLTLSGDRQMIAEPPATACD